MAKKTYETHFVLGAKMQPSVNKSFAKLQNNMKGIRNQAGYTENAYHKLGSAMKRALGAAGIYFSVSTIINVLRQSTEAARNFEDQMVDVGTLLDGDVSAKIAKYGKQNQKLAIEVGKSTEEINKGLYNVISALGETGDTYTIYRKASQNARAGNVQIAESVDFLTTVMKGYNDISAETAQKVSDLGFKTVKLGKTEFPELANSVGRVIPLAGSLGAEMEEVFGVFATLTGVTGDTAEVSTQLRGVFSSLTKPTAEMQRVIHGLGFESGKAMIEAKGLQGTLSLLQKAVGGNGQKMAQMFGRVEALNAALALTGPQAENFAEKTEAMYNAAGQSNKAFEEKIKTSKALRERFSTLVEVLKITAGNKILPVINKHLEYIVDNYEEIAAQANKAFAPVRAIYGFVSKHWTKIRPIVIGITTAMISYKTAQLAVIAAQKAGMIVQTLSNAYAVAGQFINAFRYSTLMASKAQVALNLAMSANPVAIITIAIMGLIAAGYALYKNWDKVTNGFNRFREAVSNLAFIQAYIYNLQQMVAAVKQTFGGIIDFVAGVFTADWSRAWEGAVNAFSGIFSMLDALVKAPINGVIGIVNTALQGINKINVTIPDWVPRIGGNKLGFDIPEIPMLAKGTNNFMGGSAIVGEKGPELVNMPRGSQVIPANKTKNILSRLFKNIKNIDIKIQKPDWLTSNIKTTVEHKLSLLNKSLDYPSRPENILNSLSNNNSNQEIKIHWNPEIIIEGNAKREDVKKALIETKEDFRKLLYEITGHNPRTSFS